MLLLQQRYFPRGGEEKEARRGEARRGEAPSVQYWLLASLVEELDSEVDVGVDTFADNVKESIGRSEMRLFLCCANIVEEIHCCTSTTPSLLADPSSNISSSYSKCSASKKIYISFFLIHIRLVFTIRQGWSHTHWHLPVVGYVSPWYGVASIPLLFNQWRRLNRW